MTPLPSIWLTQKRISKQRIMMVKPLWFVLQDSDMRSLLCIWLTQKRISRQRIMMVIPLWFVLRETDMRSLPSIWLTQKRISRQSLDPVIPLWFRLRRKGMMPLAFECDYCGKVWSQRRNVVAHVRIHTGNKLFESVKCPKAFTRKSNLKRHLSMRHDSKCEDL